MTNSLVPRLSAAFVLLQIVFSAQVSAAAYEDVRFLEDHGWFTDPFLVHEAGTYRATLTDMEFPAPFLELSLAVTTSTGKLGWQDYSGFFTFEAIPDTQYYLSVFYHADYVPELDKPLGLAGFDVSLLESPSDVTAVPVPGSGLLLGSALLGLVGFLRRDRRQSLT